MNVTDLRAEIEALHADPSGVRLAAGEAVDAVIDALDTGRLRVCEPTAEGWITHAWIKTAILLYFRRHDSVRIGAGGHPDQLDTPPSYFDKLPTKRNYAELGARCVPPGVARYGSYLGRGTILMPGYVNIGAYVDDGSMVDTWATVGSCAQIGERVHLSGGVGIGGVLEPAQAAPVVIEDEVMIGSRCMITQGARVGRGSVVGEGTILNPSIPVIDAESGLELGRGHVPAWSVAVQASRRREFPGGEFFLPCVLVIKRLTEGERHDKAQLNDILRHHGVST
jgi:2,3,4,5-tetrahydropyridine-2-carboxylate N-succinyltransferase